MSCHNPNRSESGTKQLYIKCVFIISPAADQRHYRWKSLIRSCYRSPCQERLFPSVTVRNALPRRVVPSHSHSLTPSSELLFPYFAPLSGLAAIRLDSHIPSSTPSAEKTAVFTITRMNIPVNVTVMNLLILS